MSPIWTPPQAKTLPRAELPQGDVQLDDGRRLKFYDDVEVEAGPDTMQYQRRWGTKNHMTVVASMDDTPHGKLLHVSVAYPNRLPQWAEVKSVRDAFFPDTVDVMMVLPRKQDYVNVHEWCMHLWQCPSGWGLQ